MADNDNVSNPDPDLDSEVAIVTSRLRSVWQVEERRKKYTFIRKTLDPPNSHSETKKESNHCETGMQLFGPNLFTKNSMPSGQGHGHGHGHEEEGQSGRSQISNWNHNGNSLIPYQNERPMVVHQPGPIIIPFPFRKYRHSPSTWFRLSSKQKAISTLNYIPPSGTSRQDKFAPPLPPLIRPIPVNPFENARNHEKKHLNDEELEIGHPSSIAFVGNCTLLQVSPDQPSTSAFASYNNQSTPIETKICADYSEFQRHAGRGVALSSSLKRKRKITKDPGVDDVQKRVRFRTPSPNWAFERRRILNSTRKTDTKQPKDKDSDEGIGILDKMPRRENTPNRDVAAIIEGAFENLSLSPDLQVDNLDSHIPTPPSAALMGIIHSLVNATYTSRSQTPGQDQKCLRQAESERRMECEADD